MPIFGASSLSPPGKKRALHLKIFFQGCFVSSLVEIGPVVPENMEMLKVNRQTDGQTDEGQQTIKNAHLSFQLR